MKLDAIDLKRRFLELRQTDDEAADRALVDFGLTKAFSWDDVLRHPCVVVLGEAGTGKTTEFCQRAALLRARGLTSFFVTIDDLSSQGLTSSLTTSEERQLNAWRASGGQAYFFLDAVDEARLEGPRFGIFKSALRKLERELGSDLRRAHIVMSCRVSDWRAQSDCATVDDILFPEAESSITFQLEDTRLDKPADEVQGPAMLRTEERSPPAKSIGDETGKVRVYALAPLDEQAVRMLAQHFGATEPDDFLHAARDAAAHPYLDRPRDVEWLVGYWLRHHKLGSLTELIENDIQEKLTERNDDRSQRCSLPLTRVREAVLALAGVSVLERRITFRLPDGGLDAERAATSVDPAAVLPDLQPVELREVLTRPIFGEATYGRVRIHHRSVAEFLAAEWLDSLVEHGLSPIDMDTLLFRQHGNVFAVPDELVSVAVWLSATNEAVRERLLVVAPFAFLQSGDPSRLPSDFRRRLLATLANQYKDRKRWFKSRDRVVLSRLAASDTVDSLNDLLRTSTEEEFLETLIEIVAEGDLVACVEQVVRIATSFESSNRAKIEAIRAVAKIGTPEQCASVLRLQIEGVAQISHEAGAALVDLYPKSMSIDQLVVLLSRVKPPPPHTVTLLPYLGPSNQKVDRNRVIRDRQDLPIVIYTICRSRDVRGAHPHQVQRAQGLDE